MNAEALNNQIEGVVVKPLKTFPDDRGFFREIIRENDPFFGAGFAQWSHSKMAKNTVKAWHYHHVQTDWWYCGLGVIEVVLYDLRNESPTLKKKLVFKTGDQEADNDALSVVFSIPPGVLHACKVMSDTAHLFYITSEIYNPNDEGRYAYNSKVVPHDWKLSPSQMIVSAKDSVDFVPTASRKPIR